MPSSIDTNAVVRRLRTLESVAIIPRVASTNLIARRIVTECIDNELSLPQAIIIAREQFAGRGRNDRHWSSPAGKGIYATILLSRPVVELPLIPLAIANLIAEYLEETFAIDARVKWPNDIYVGGRKIAGILIEARVQDDRVFLLIGTGINLEPVRDDDRPNATSIREVTSRDSIDLDVVTTAYIEHADSWLSRPLTQEEVLGTWRRRTVHQAGDAIRCVLGDRTIEGRWRGIDDDGRALLDTSDGVVAVSAGDLMLV